MYLKLQLSYSQAKIKKIQKRLHVISFSELLAKYTLNKNTDFVSINNQGMATFFTKN